MAVFRLRSRCIWESPPAWPTGAPPEMSSRSSWRTTLWWTSWSCRTTTARSSTPTCCVESSEGPWRWWGPVWRWGDTPAERTKWPLLLFVCVIQVQMAVDVRFAQDTLRGDNVTEIRMKFIKRIEENLPAGDEWWRPSVSLTVTWRGANHTGNSFTVRMNDLKTVRRGSSLNFSYFHLLFFFELVWFGEVCWKLDETVEKRNPTWLHSDVEEWKKWNPWHLEGLFLDVRGERWALLCPSRRLFNHLGGHTRSSFWIFVDFLCCPAGKHDVILLLCLFISNHSTWLPIAWHTNLCQIKKAWNITVPWCDYVSMEM